ncbi:MAG: tRNA pseudouridine(55) synthase TruB [Defluviitaleaceae bacterium]|nr:tRNA pseudouridine(55) synthase TruB [Defluviitaleaceae bacterium]
MTGIINVRKEKNFTSHDVVAIIRKITREKTGHTGTLDPNATGVLPICVGRATKLADYLAAQEKTYVAEIILGITTDTFDATGKILSEKKVSVGFEELKTAAESFVGEYFQTPPMFSAIKIGGKKLYELARKGIEIERAPRLVKIFSLNVFRYEEICNDEKFFFAHENEFSKNFSHGEDGFSDSRPARFFIETTCSKGTYIRSLCADIGEKLGCGAVMGDLVRTRSGIFSLENSFSLAEIKMRAGCHTDKEGLPTAKPAFEDLSQSKNRHHENALSRPTKNFVTCNKLEDIILSAEEVLPYPSLLITPEILPRALNGNPLPAENLSDGEKFWLKTNDRTIGLFCVKNGFLRVEVML